MNRTFSVIGRIIYGITIGFFGVNHFTHTDAMSGMIPPFLSSFSMPLVYFTGACLLIAALSIIINKGAMWSGFFLAMFLFLVVLTVHIPHFPDQMAITMMIKDTSMAGAALFIAGNAR